MNNPYFDLIRAVWTHGKPWRVAIVGYYLAYVFAQAAMSLSPYAFGRTIDLLQNFKPEQLGAVIFWLSMGIVVTLVFWLFHGPARVVERKVALKIQQTFRINFYEQLTHMPLKWHQDQHSGDIITRINRASTALYRFAESQFIYIETIIKFLASIGFLLWISLPVGLLSLLTCVISALAVVLFDRKLIPLYTTQNEIDNRVGAVFFDYISNMTTVLTLRLNELTRSNVFQRMMSVWPFFKKDTVINEVKWFSMGILLSSLQSLILIGYIVYTLESSQIIMIGLVVMIFRYQWDLSEVFYNLSAHYSELVRMDTDLKGLDPIRADMQRLAHPLKGERIARQWHTLDIKQLKFHHTEEHSRGKMFDEINLHIKRGEKIALIGKSGGGKSTLLNVLSGLYTPEQVTLHIDGMPFTSLEPLHAITTLIPQDPEIFANTLAFNIAMDLTTSLADIETAVKLAGFAPVLATLPLGLETDIREKGLNFSVGQKQRLALARGLFAARFSSLILMDEPTSSVDLATEQEILCSVLDAFPDAAMIVSLHRLHLLPKFDRIIMLSDGKIIADGKTSELLHTSGPVQDLWHLYGKL